MNKIKVLVVDDSALMRKIVSDIIAEDERLTLLATARDGLDALSKIETEKPDVVTMDFDMPRLDGLETLAIIMSKNPLPVIILSSQSQAGSGVTIKALELGAVDFMPKPGAGELRGPLKDFKEVLLTKIITAAVAQVSLVAEKKPKTVFTQPFSGAVTEPVAAKSRAPVIIALGASTGGPKALETFFSHLPADLPAVILLSQHMPPGFTQSFSERLNQISEFRVKEAEEGDRLLQGCAYVAPGNYHMVVDAGIIRLDSGPKVNYVRPAIDVMLDSLHQVSQKVLVAIFTGMGKDGASGARALKKSKSDLLIVAQDPATALIPSMPEALIKSVACDVIAPLEKLAPEISRLVRLLAAS